MLIRKFVLSCDIFSGYECDLDMDCIEDIDQLITHVLDKLANDLRSLKLIDLQYKLNSIRSNYHLHDYEFGHILVNPDTYYICSHCDALNTPDD